MPVTLGDLVVELASGITAAAQIGDYILTPQLVPAFVR